jgi:hypothetical protein
MFPSFFRFFNEHGQTAGGSNSNSNREAPTARELLEYSNRCLDTYREIVDMNKKIASELAENTRRLMPHLGNIRTCPNNHNLTLYTAIGGNCDVCNRIVFVGEQVMDCRACNWYMCSRCARNNQFTMPQQPSSFQSVFNELLRPLPAPPTTQSQMFAFDIPLNGRGFDDFITQLTQSLSEITPHSQDDVIAAPTEDEIDRACLVMQASTANLGDQYVCPIDLSPISNDESVMMIKHCQHIFRESNLRLLFSRDCRCPLCRFDIREHDE